MVFILIDKHSLLLHHQSYITLPTLSGDKFDYINLILVCVFYVVQETIHKKSFIYPKLTYVLNIESFIFFIPTIMQFRWCLSVFILFHAKTTRPVLLKFYSNIFYVHRIVQAYCCLEKFSGLCPMGLPRFHVIHMKKIFM